MNSLLGGNSWIPEKLTWEGSGSWLAKLQPYYLLISSTTVAITLYTLLSKLSGLEKMSMLRSSYRVRFV